MKSTTLASSSAHPVIVLLCGLRPTALLVLSWILLQGAASAQIPLRIIDRLGQNQAAEQVRITIGGVTKSGQLKPGNPVAYADFILPTPGAYACEIRVETRFNGEKATRSARRDGTIMVFGGEVLAITGDFSQNPARLGLVQTGTLPLAPAPSFDPPASSSLTGGFPVGSTYDAAAQRLPKTCTLCRGSGYFGKKFIPGMFGEGSSSVDQVCSGCGGSGMR